MRNNHLGKDKIAIVAGNMLTAYGYGINTCWDALLDGKSAIKPTKRFLADKFISNLSAEYDKVDPLKNSFYQLLTPILIEAKKNSFKDTFYIFSSTLGDIESLEKEPEISKKNSVISVLDHITDVCKLDHQPLLVSSACASSANAVIHGSSMIKMGLVNSVAILCCDIVSEFIFSGFSTLQALSPKSASPFDRKRSGLNIGEGAAFIIITSESFARSNDLSILGYIEGCGTSSDSYNIVSPDPNGESLSLAILDALNMADITADKIESICAHGTGTIFNDEMEINAIKNIFPKKTYLYSIKGGTGHTMGNAGLIELLIALESLNRGDLPPTVGLKNPYEAGAIFVSNKKQKTEAGYTLSINSGFGGINTAIILKKLS